MAKPKGMQWLEQQTGQVLDYEPPPPVSERHLSVRLGDDLATDLAAMAAERGVTVSHLVRDLLTEAISRRRAVGSLDERALAERLAADAAELHRRLAG